MIFKHNNQLGGRFEADAGIAIGPILFVIAVLGILAAAIAAGSGSFTAGSTAENNRTKAAAMIEIGQNLKIGWERITGSAEVDFDLVNINVNNTSAENDLFSPLGGGITAPSVTLANQPSVDRWHYPLGNFVGLGTGNNPNQWAILKVSQGVCTEVNSKANGMSATPTAKDVGNIEVDDATVADSYIVDNWPAELNGKPLGCVNNTNDTSEGHYFYQIIGIR